MAAQIAGWIADAVALLHAAILIIFVWGAVSVLHGGFAVTPLALWKRFYLAVVFATGVMTLCLDRCPLTRVECWLRGFSDPAASYDTSYVAHYLPFIPPDVDGGAALVLMTIGCAGMIQALWNWLRA